MDPLDPITVTMTIRRLVATVDGVEVYEDVPFSVWEPYDGPPEDVEGTARDTPKRLNP